MTEMPIIVPRYTVEDWCEWVSMSSDQMCASWAEWNEGIERFFNQAAKNRATVYEVTVRPAEFRNWAEKNGKPLNGVSRSEYAGWLIKDRFLIPPKLPVKLPKHAEMNRLLRQAIKSNPDISLSDISSPHLRRPEASICPIFRLDDSGATEQFGSGVLVRISDHHFLLSAAHVLDSFKSHTILIPGREHLIEIFGKYSVTNLPAEGRDKDEIDFGYFHFKNGQEEEIHDSLLFLDEADCNAMDVTNDGDAYTVIGYPADLSELTGGKASTEITRITCSGVMDHRYEKLGLKADEHLLLQYRMKKGISQRTLTPGIKFDFGGISGGGVFAWSKSLPDSRALDQPYLVGMVTTYSPHHNVFQVTRLGSVLRGIQKEFPHLPIVKTERKRPE